MNAGYLFVATGQSYAEEALDAIKSLRMHNPNCVVCLVCDEQTASGLNATGIDILRTVQSPFFDFRDKILAMIDSPFNHTVFLDTDVRVVHNLEFEAVLDRFDLAFCWDPIRTDFELPEIPRAFPTPNTGVIAWRKCIKTEQLLRNWHAVFEHQLTEPCPPLHDQPAFRKVLFESDTRFLVLPDEFNLRIIYPHMIGGNTRISILHGRHAHLESALEYAESVHFYPRVFGRNYYLTELLSMISARIKNKLIPAPVRKKVGVTWKA